MYKLCTQWFFCSIGRRPSTMNSPHAWFKIHRTEPRSAIWLWNLRLRTVIGPCSGYSRKNTTNLNAIFDANGGRKNRSCTYHITKYEIWGGTKTLKHKGIKPRALRFVWGFCGAAVRSRSAFRSMSFPSLVDLFCLINIYGQVLGTVCAPSMPASLLWHNSGVDEKNQAEIVHKYVKVGNKIAACSHPSAAIYQWVGWVSEKIT